MKMVEGAMDQGVWMTSNAGKGNEKDSLSQPLGRKSPVQPLDFNPIKCIQDLQP
jgi:hypothetical protein